MITVKIAGLERQWGSLDDIDEAWLAEQLTRRRAAGERPCVIVRVTTSSANVALSTPNCPTTGRGWRRPNEDERRILDLWSKRGLNEPEFVVGGLVAFLRQLGRLL